jgi:hypothetical protein
VRPEALVAGKPEHGFFHRVGGDPAHDRAAGLPARDEPGVREDVEMLHDSGQRHGMRSRQLRHGQFLVFAKLRDDRAPGRIGKRGEGAVEAVLLILNHSVKCRPIDRLCQAACSSPAIHMRDSAQGFSVAKPLPFKAPALPSRTAGSSMVAGMDHGSPSAIFFMVPRRILPERVLGRRPTVMATRKAAIGPIFSRTRHEAHELGLDLARRTVDAGLHHHEAARHLALRAARRQTPSRQLNRRAPIEPASARQSAQP